VRVRSRGHSGGRFGPAGGPDCQIANFVRATLAIRGTGLGSESSANESVYTGIFPLVLKQMFIIRADEVSDQE